MQEFSLITEDGFSLAVKIFAAENSQHKLLLINSATGVKQQLYFSLAKYLAQAGITVITYDYRGIGESKPKNLRNFSASMRLWGTEDFAAVNRFIQEKFPDYDKFCLGHSVGALILGMNQGAKIFSKFIFVATQDAHYKNLKFSVAATAFVGFGVALPVLTKMLGYFPAHAFNIGESLPTNVAKDWRTLILNRKSTSKLYEKITTDFSKELHQKTLVIFADDDAWVTPQGMESLMKNVYPNLNARFLELKSWESPQNEIGHVNFFRSFNAPLWIVIINEILN